MQFLSVTAPVLLTVFLFATTARSYRYWTESDIGKIDKDVAIMEDKSTPRVKEELPLRIENVIQILKKFSEGDDPTNCHECVVNFYKDILQQLTMIPPELSRERSTFTLINRTFVDVANEALGKFKNDLEKINQLYDSSVEYQKEIAEVNGNLLIKSPDSFLNSIFDAPQNLSATLSKIYDELIAEKVYVTEYYPGEPPYVYHDYYPTDDVAKILKDAYEPAFHVGCSDWWAQPSVMMEMLVTILEAEIKGTLTLLHGYALRGFFDNEMPYDELNELKNATISRITGYGDGLKPSWHIGYATCS